jgi:hypothetical protein
MKSLFLIPLLLLVACTSPRYIYVVDDVYFSRQTPRTPQYSTPPFVQLPPYDHWRWQQRRAPKPFIAPRRVDLESYRSQFAPPPPPPSIEKKEEVKEETKQAPVRKFKK